MNNVPSSRLLPERPSVSRLKRQAKELLAEALDADGAALSRLIRPQKPPILADAHRAIAVEYGFASWPRLRAAVDSLAAGEASTTTPMRPRRADKFREPKSVWEPSVFLGAAFDAGWDPGPLPEAVIFCFRSIYPASLESDDRFEENPDLAVGNGRLFMTKSSPRVAVSCMSIGAVAMVSQVENLISLGDTRQFVVIGVAGGIGADVDLGDVVIVDSALRDDGLSDHYLRPGDCVEADVELSGRLHDACGTRASVVSSGSSWTIPAVYRQTKTELDHCVAEGVSVVEGEIASLFAVALARGVQASAAVVVTSQYREGRFVMTPDQKGMAKTQLAVLDAAIETVSRA